MKDKFKYYLAWFNEICGATATFIFKVVLLAFAIYILWWYFEYEAAKYNFFMKGQKEVSK